MEVVGTAARDTSNACIELEEYCKAHAIESFREAAQKAKEKCTHLTLTIDQTLTDLEPEVNITSDDVRGFMAMGNGPLVNLGQQEHQNPVEQQVMIVNEPQVDLGQQEHQNPPDQQAMEMVHCGCKQHCRTRSCSCFKGERKCNSSCRCKGNCFNHYVNPPLVRMVIKRCRCKSSKCEHKNCSCLKANKKCNDSCECENCINW